jgi:Tfp pilus assembly protein PilV
MHASVRPQRGVSLIEALVALLVMAFGMLAVVGVQMSLRSNADVSKQRAEALHIGEVEIEKWRGYTSLDAAEGQTSYAGLTSTATEEGVVTANTVYGNAKYTLRRTVTAGAGMKTLVIDVSWVDRAGRAQTIRFDTLIAAVVPGLGGTLSVPAFGTPTRQPLDRNIGIPASAQPIDGNRSVFRPTTGGSAALAWVFDNVTGVIISQCRAPDTTMQATISRYRELSQCESVSLLPISGYVRFGRDLAGPAMNMRMDVGSATATCLDDSPKSSSASPNAYVTYVCAVTTTTIELVAGWSGRPRVTLCPTAAATCPARGRDKLTAEGLTFLECRFQPHPSDGYVRVSIPLANQNFAVATTCPAGSDSN